jgi:hypothetical protein
MGQGALIRIQDSAQLSAAEALPGAAGGRDQQIAATARLGRI